MITIEKKSFVMESGVWLTEFLSEGWWKSLEGGWHMIWIDVVIPGFVIYCFSHKCTFNVPLDFTFIWGLDIY